MLHEVNFYIVYELKNSCLMDRFFIEKIDESCPFCFPEVKKLSQRHKMMHEMQRKPQIKLYRERT